MTAGTKYLGLAAVLATVMARLKESGAAGKRDDPLAGVVWVTISMASLAALAALGRHAALKGLDPFEVLFFRNLFCLIWLLPLFAWRGVSLVRTEQPRLYVMRVALSFVSMQSMFHAFALISIGETTAISFLSPLFGTLFAIALLGERVRARRWTALAVGFIGAMIILRPGGVEFGLGQVAALISAMTVGMIGPLVKQLTAKDDADRIVFITTLLMTPISLIPALFVWQWPASELWPYLALLGLVAVIGHLTLVRGYAATDASLAMTFKFSRLPFAVAIGYVAFGETIDLWTWLGALIIFAAAAYVTRRESQMKAESAGPTLASSDPLSLTPVERRD